MHPVGAHESGEFEESMFALRHLGHDAQQQEGDPSRPPARKVI